MRRTPRPQFNRVESIKCRCAPSFLICKWGGPRGVRMGSIGLIGHIFDADSRETPPRADPATAPTRPDPKTFRTVY